MYIQYMKLTDGSDNFLVNQNSSQENKVEIYEKGGKYLNGKPYRFALNFLLIFKSYEEASETFLFYITCHVQQVIYSLYGFFFLLRIFLSPNKKSD